MSKMLAAVLKRTGQPRKPVAEKGREGDLTKQNFHAGSTGSGFDGSPTPGHGAGPNRPGKPRAWPKKSLELQEGASDDPK